MCFLILIGLIAPRLVIILLWLFSNYLSRAFGTWVLPLIGFFVLPFTTLAWAYSVNSLGGVSGFGLILVIAAFLADIGVFRSGYRSRR